MNNDLHKSERDNAIIQIKKKAKRVKRNEENIFNTEKIDSCKCLKTHCKKKYCECFVRG